MNRRSFFVKKGAEDAVKWLEDLAKRIKPVQEGKYAVVGATLVGGKDFQTIPDSVVIVENGRIAAVGSRREITIPRRMKTLDASGKTLLPGFSIRTSTRPKRNGFLQCSPPG